VTRVFAHFITTPARMGDKSAQSFAERKRRPCAVEAVMKR